MKAMNLELKKLLEKCPKHMRVRLYHSLLDINITNIEKLKKVSTSKLLEARNLGRESLHIIGELTNRPELLYKHISCPKCGYIINEKETK